MKGRKKKKQKQLFASFVEGQRQLITCLHDDPKYIGLRNKVVIHYPPAQTLQDAPKDGYTFLRSYGPYYNKRSGQRTKIEDIFAFASRFIPRCLYGVNLFLIFYGAPESGKSHLIRTPEGFIFLTVKRLSSEIKSKAPKDIWTHSVKASDWGIVNNDDIIDALEVGEDWKAHSVLEDLDGEGSHISNLTKVELKDETEVSKLLAKAEINRNAYIEKNTTITYKPRMSSVFQLHVKGYNVASTQKKRGSIFIVELGEDITGEIDIPHVTYWEEYMEELSAIKIELPSARSKLINFIHQNRGELSKTLVYATVSPDEQNFRASEKTIKYAWGLRKRAMFEQKNKETSKS